MRGVSHRTQEAREIAQRRPWPLPLTRASRRLALEVDEHRWRTVAAKELPEMQVAVNPREQRRRTARERREPPPKLGRRRRELRARRLGNQSERLVELG